MVYKIQTIIFLLFFIFSCSNSDLDKLSSTLTKDNNKNDTSSINQQPIAIISIDKNITFRENTDIRLDATNSFDSDGSIVSYLWKNGDKIIGNTKTISVKFASAVYIIELQVEDDKGSKGKVKQQISVSLDFDKINLDINSLEEIATLKASTKDINQILIKNNHLYASSNDGKIYSWELLFNKLLNPSSILVSEGYEVKSIFISDNKIFSGSSDGNIKVWDIKTKLLLQTIKNHRNAITSLVGNDDIVAFSSIDKSISIFSLHSNKLIATIKEHKSPIMSLEIIENFLISYSSNKIIKIWDMDKNYKNVGTTDLINNKVDFMMKYKKKLITLSKDGLIVVRDIFENTILQEKQIDSIRAVGIYNSYIIVALDNKDINIINIDDVSEKNILKLEHRAVSIYANEGILAIGLDNQEIKIFGNKERFKKR